MSQHLYKTRITTSTQLHHAHPPFLFFFNDTATTEIYTLSLHDALPISDLLLVAAAQITHHFGQAAGSHRKCGDRKSTRLNSSHANISYAVFCLKKKKRQRSGLQVCQNHTAIKERCRPLVSIMLLISPGT